MEKRCFKCNAVKPLSDFYKHPRMADGHLNKCKECAKRDVHQNRDEKRDYYILYDRMRNDDPERTAARLEGVERRKHALETRIIKERRADETAVLDARGRVLSPDHR